MTDHDIVRERAIVIDLHPEITRCAREWEALIARAETRWKEVDALLASVKVTAQRQQELYWVIMATGAAAGVTVTLALQVLLGWHP